LLRSYRIIIRKACSNYTSNFSLYNCKLSLNELKELFYTVLVEDKNKYFKQEFKFIDSWGCKGRGASHYIIIQNVRQKVNESMTISACLHDFDHDEIRDILSKVFCCKKEEIKNGGKN
jgi:hypothetical protein